MVHVEPSWRRNLYEYGDDPRSATAVHVTAVPD
jgi:hypothetical protein